MLADEAIPVAEVSRAQAESRLTAATSELAAVDRMDVAAQDSAMSRMLAARAMLAAAEAP